MGLLRLNFTNHDSSRGAGDLVILNKVKTLLEEGTATGEELAGSVALSILSHLSPQWHHHLLSA
jgi:hypothetical protein